jgi:hypothetical protein
MHDLVVNSLHILNSFLTAGIAITAFSLLLYALSFNLRDRVARTFAIILLCVVIVFVGEALSSVVLQPKQLEFWLRLQWVGIIFLPAAYAHLSDALLATTGKPSRGRRRLLVRTMYSISLAFLLTLPSNLLVGPLIQAKPAPHLERTWLTWIFAIYYLIAMVFSWNNFLKAHQRTVTSTSRRRMVYLLMGALAPALGSYPYLLFGSGIAAQHPLIFWLAVTLSNLLVTILLVLMAYAVAFFGVSWPDRMVKRRLFKWLMRGPVTASTVLVITTIVRRMGNWLEIDLSAAVPVIMVSFILILEHLITLISPIWERRLFFGKDQADMELLQTLDERLLTLGDLRQFLESILAAVCDRLQSPKAFIATLDNQGIDTMVTIGGENLLEEEDINGMLLNAVAQNGKHREIFTWGDYWLVPMFDQEMETHEMIGLLGVRRQSTTEGKPSSRIEEGDHLPENIPDGEQREALTILAERAALAIDDRFRQQQAFSSLVELAPRMDMFQRLRAATRYDGTEILTTSDFSLEQDDLSPMVKDALAHYWGGPKLTKSPLLNLRIVQQTAMESEENSINALRAILRKAIENVRPEGERRFTGEWILYNILEMKFMEGRKVREIAMRLAMSEADLYRKQRVAIEAVAKAILEMEQQIRQELTIAVETNMKTNIH